MKAKSLFLFMYYSVLYFIGYFSFIFLYNIISFVLQKKTIMTHDCHFRILQLYQNILELLNFLKILKTSLKKKFCILAVSKK